MGEIAEMYLDGTLCETCGVFLDGETPGYTRYCEECQKQQKEPVSSANATSQNINHQYKESITHDTNFNQPDQL